MARPDSENGWRPGRVGGDALVWVTVPGSRVTLQLMKGWPSIVMGAYAADYHAYVEPLRDADSAGYTATNSVATSNHLNGTAMDLNWNSHPFRVSYAGYTPSMIATMGELVAFYEGTMFWAQAWSEPKDAMHHQMGYDTWNDAKVGDFITRKVRADGFSTFRRGNTQVAPTHTRAERYAQAIIAEGRRLQITPRGIIIGLSVALVETNLTMYANSNDTPSLALPHDAVGHDHMSSGLFQQQTAWGTLAARMDPTASARIFFTVDNGGGVRGLTKIRDADGDLYDYDSTAHSMGFYAQKVQGSAFPDRYDQRMDEATALFSRLANVASLAPPAPNPSGEGFLMALTDDEQRELLSLARQEGSQARTSRSPLRHVGEHDTETLAGFEWNTDANVHVLYVELRARLGDPDSLALLHEVANADPEADPDRVNDRHLAQAILNNLAAIAAIRTNSVPYPEPTPMPDSGPTPRPPTLPIPGGDGGLQSNIESLNSEVSSLRAALRSLAAWVRT